MTQIDSNTGRVTSSWIVAAALFVTVGVASISLNEPTAPTSDVAMLTPQPELAPTIGDIAFEPEVEPSDGAVLDTEGFAPPQN